LSFKQHYSINNKKFYNIFLAFDEHRKNKGWIDYVVDDEFVQSLNDIRRPKILNSQHIKNLLVKGLKQCRRKYSKVRLALGGGTDSWTILKLCEQYDIHIDEVLCCLVSLTGNPRVDMEYLPGLKYAKSLEGSIVSNVVTVRPSEESLSYIDDPDWFKKTTGPSLPVRPLMMGHFGKKIMNDKKNEFITITGMEKPTLLVEDGKIFWTLIDRIMGEWMGLENHYPLFLDKNNPELTVSLAYAFLESLPKNYMEQDGLFCYETIKDKNIQNNILEQFGMRLDKPWLNHHYHGKALRDTDSIKNRRFAKELENLGLGDHIKKYHINLQSIYNEYKDLPYAMTNYDNNIQTVGRYSQKIPIFKDHFGRTLDN
jgi:hypothetical protein